jgi:hypothetical protein
MGETDSRAPVAIYSSRRTGLFRLLLKLGRVIRDAREAGEDVRVTVERVPRD